MFCDISHIHDTFVLSLCTCDAPVKVCCACEVFDYAAFGRVIFKSYNCVIRVLLCGPCERVSLKNHQVSGVRVAHKHSTRSQGPHNYTRITQLYDL